MSEIKFNYVGIDTSLSSTGVYIRTKEGKNIYYNYRNTDKMTKWHKVLSYINYESYENYKAENYSDTEICKLLQYNKITDKILSDIISHCKPEETIVITEGFSYSSSNTSSLIDLVSYATLLRNKIISYDFYNLTIKSPSTLKADTCIMVYGPGEKKKPARNNEGIAGGKFTKREMLKSAFDFNMEIEIINSLLFYKDDLLGMKSIPKPIDDMMDAVWLVWSEFK